MKRALHRSLSLYSHSFHAETCSNLVNSNPSVSSSVPFRFRFFSSDMDSSDGASTTVAASKSTALARNLKNAVDVQVVSKKVNELKERIEKYFKGYEEALPSIMEAILQRRLSKKHEDTDDELMEELKLKPLDDVKDKEFESNFEELYSTDEEIDDLYSARDIVVQKWAKDEFFNMDDKKWDGKIQESIRHGHLQNTKECEEILEDMLHWDKLLPDDMKRKLEDKFNELGDMCEKGELLPEEAYELFKEFEDEMVMEYGNKMEVEKADDTCLLEKKRKSDDPPGEGVMKW